jgi:transposase
MAHHNESIRVRVIAVIEEGGLSASAADGRYGVTGTAVRAWIQKYQTDGQVGRRRRTGLWRLYSSTQDGA